MAFLWASLSESARNWSMFNRMSFTPGLGQSVRHSTRSATSARRGKYSSSRAGGIPDTSSHTCRWRRRIGLGVPHGEAVRGVREADDVRRGIVHESHAPHPRLIHYLEQRAGIVHQPDEEVPLRLFAAAHGLDHGGLHVAPGLDMDVDVRDAAQSLQE